MASSVKSIKRRLGEIARRADEIVEKAEHSGRGVSQAESDEMRGLYFESERLEQQLKGYEGTQRRLASIPGRDVVMRSDGSIISDGDGWNHESVGGKIADAFRLKADSGQPSRWSTGVLEIETKALLGTPTAGALVQADVQPGIAPKLFQRLTVADLMGAGTTASNLVRVMVESVVSNAAAGVAEGAPKPESTLEFDVVDEPVKKIATFLPVADEILEDVGQLQSYIDGRLRLFVQMEEERQLLHGAGGAEINGLLGRIPVANQGVTASGTGVTGLDHIRAAMAVVRASFLEPDGVVIAPSDYESLVSLKDGSGAYIAGNPWDGDAGRTLYGLRLAVTSAVDAGSPIVGAFGVASRVHRRGGISVEMSNSHADFFQTNRTAIRAEERLALEISRPEAFATAAL